MQYFNDLSSYLKKNFGDKVYKVSLNSGLGCPNWSKGACSFCEPKSYSPVSHTGDQSIEEQFKEGMQYVIRRHHAKSFIAHFQAGTATNAPVNILKEQLSSVLKFKNVIGVAVSTRPDCLSEECFDLMEEIKNSTKVFWLELGLQTVDDNILKNINRGHDLKQFVDAVKAANKRDIDICAHIIIGLPGDTHSGLMKTAKLLNDLKIWGVKIHNLHVVKGTRLEKDYMDGKVPILSLDEYANLTVDFIEHLLPEMIIHRVNAHGPRHLTIAPKWSVNKLAIMNAVVNEFRRRGSKQGSKCSDLL